MTYFLSLDEIAIRYAVAAACGLLLGIEREMKHKPAGVRVYILVTIGSATFTMLLGELTAYYADHYSEITMDPTRIVQGIIAGIGFLGGGAIIQSKNNVTGVGTGAGIWICGAIGIACGYGLYWYAAIVTTIVFVVLGILGMVRAELRDDLDKDDGDA